MGRPIRRLVATKRDRFDQVMKNWKISNLYRIENVEVYWGDDDAFVLVAPEEWCDFLHGKREDPPQEVDAGVFEIDSADLGLLFEI